MIQVLLVSYVLSNERRDNMNVYYIGFRALQDCKEQSGLSFPICIETSFYNRLLNDLYSRNLWQIVLVKHTTPRRKIIDRRFLAPKL